MFGKTVGSVLAAILIGYALGCLSPSFLIGKLHGIDVRVAGRGPLGGTAAILGHIFPVTLHFHGGKGLACIGGVVLAYSPRTLLFLLGVALLIGVLTRYVAVVTVSMSVIWPLYYGLVTSLWLGAAILAVPALPIFCKHVENFRRMRSGEELRLSFPWNRDAELARVGREDEIGK